MRTSLVASLALLLALSGCLGGAAPTDRDPVPPSELVVANGTA